MAIAKNHICLWYDNDAEAAARFYAETFPDSALHVVHLAPSDYPSGKAGDVLTVDSQSRASPVSASTAAPYSSIAKPSRSRLPLTIRRRPTIIGTPLSAMVAEKVCAVGARTNGASPGKSRRAR